MQNSLDLARFSRLSFESFKSMANDDSLSKYQKIGFPDSYREGKEQAIFYDILSKLDIDPEKKNLTLLDIGPGCTDVPTMILEFCTKNEYQVLLADCDEMLAQLPDGQNITKFPGYFPDECGSLISDFQNKVDYIICYSVLHAAFYHTCIFNFIDSAVSLLKPGGKLLLGDLPNISKRKRFFSTDAGIEFHQAFTDSTSLPEVNHLQLEPFQIDDGIIFSILQRYRNFGFETYLLPQPKELSMSNRREDILICKI